MKVLNILDDLSVDSGVSSVVMDIHKNFADATQVDFLVFRKYKNHNNSYNNEIISRGSGVFYCDNPLSLKGLLNGMKQGKNFLKVHAKDYDIVHLHSPTISLFTLRYAKKFGIKCRIIHSHSSMTSPNKLKALINKFLMSGKKYANVYWACSDVAAEFLYGTKENIEIIRNAVDCEKIFFDEKLRDSSRNELDLKDKMVITHISNFSPIKNHSFLVNVIKEVVKEDKNFVFLFVGDGPAKAEFEAEIRENNLGNSVIFAGRQKDVKKYLCASDLLLLPSIKEGLPVVVVEAQACGMPCLVSDTVTKQCDAGNVSFLTLNERKWIEKIMNFASYTDEERRKMSEKFKTSEFNAAIEAKRVEELYKNLVNKNKNGEI